MKLFPYNRSQTIRIIFIVAVVAIVIRVILDSRFATSALLYLAVPFAVSVLIHQFIPYEVEDSRGR
jgi:diacylglycerol kinase